MLLAALQATLALQLKIRHIHLSSRITYLVFEFEITLIVGSAEFTQSPRLKGKTSLWASSPGGMDTIGKSGVFTQIEKILLYRITVGTGERGMTGI